MPCARTPISMADMSRKPRDPVAVAVLLVSMLVATLIVFLASAAVRKKAGDRREPFVPPGWVGPTSPPPGRQMPEKAP